MSELSLKAMSPDEQITISMASIPSRLDGMIEVVEQLLPSCDHFDISLNGYPAIDHPLFHDPKVHIIHSDPEMGARGKFLMSARTPGYHVIVDDDIHYPADYVMKMVEHVEHFKRRAVVGVHGKLFVFRKPPDPITYEYFNYIYELNRYRMVHMLGTGTIAYHSSAFPLDASDLGPGKIDDQVAIYCQENYIPQVVVPRPQNWMQDMEDVSVRNALRKDPVLKRIASDRIANYPHWRLFDPGSTMCRDW